MKRIFTPFLTFIALFIGTGFVSGSIVHMGEGINMWDLSLLAVGAVLFVSGSVAQDIQQGTKRIRDEGIGAFLGLSLLLSIGIGMASGGMQHFVDTPSYSSILIPLGLGIGFFAFVLKERMALTQKEWATIVPLTCMGMALSMFALSAAAEILPKTLMQNHHAPVDGSAPSSAHTVDNGHGH